MNPNTQQPLFMSPNIPQPMEPMKQPKSKKKLLVIVLVVIVLLVVGSIIVVVASKKSGVKNQGTPNTASPTTKSHVIEFLTLVSDHKLDDAYNLTNSQKVSKEVFVKISSQNLGVNFKLTECKVMNETEQNNILTTIVTCPYYESTKTPAKLTFVSEQKDGSWLIDNYTVGN